MTSITVPRDALASELTFCGSAVNKRHHIEILKGVLFTVRKANLFIRATDLELTAFASVLSAEDSPTKDGEFTTELSPLLSFVRSAPEEFIEMMEDKGYVTLTSGNAKLRLPTLPAEDFPADPRVSSGEETEFAALPMEILKSLVKSAAYAANEVEMRFQLNGCLLSVVNHKLEAASTDGHRIGIASTAAAKLSDESAQIFVPKVGLGAVTAFPADEEECAIAESENGVSITCGIRALNIRKADVNFPAYREAVPKSLEQSVEIDVAGLLASVRRTLVAAAASRAVTFAFAPGRLKLSASDATRLAEELISVDYSGPEIELTMTGDYVVDALGAVDCEKVTVRFMSGNVAVLIAPVADDDAELGQLHQIMLMRK